MCLVLILFDSMPDDRRFNSRIIDDCVSDLRGVLDVVSGCVIFLSFGLFMFLRLGELFWSTASDNQCDCRCIYNFLQEFVNTQDPLAVARTCIYSWPG